MLSILTVENAEDSAVCNCVAYPKIVVTFSVKKSVSTPNAFWNVNGLPVNSSNIVLIFVNTSVITAVDACMIEPRFAKNAPKSKLVNFSVIPLISNDSTHSAVLPTTPANDVVIESNAGCILLPIASLRESIESGNVAIASPPFVETEINALFISSTLISPAAIASAKLSISPPAFL